MKKTYYLLKLIPLRLRLHIYYFLKFKRLLNLKKPLLYSEKIQKRKLNLLDSYSKLSDKLLVKNYISQIIGNEHIIPTIFSCKKPDEIKFNELPNKFVIKTNFGSGAKHISIINDKTSINEDEIIKKFNLALKDKYQGSILGECQYDSIEKNILIEEFIESNDSDIDDFKFHIFNSKDGFLQIDFDRFKNHKRNLYDFSFNELDYGLCYPKGEYKLPPLNKLNEMKDIAFKLSEGFDFVRVDLYLVGEQILFGEMTFTPGSGFEKFSDPNADKLYGSMWVQN